MCIHSIQVLALHQELLMNITWVYFMLLCFDPSRLTLTLVLKVKLPLPLSQRKLR